MSLEFVTGELHHQDVDAVVIPCSPHPVITEGMNDTLYQVGGSALFAARQTIGALPFGRAALTPAFALSAKSAIHVAIPPCQADNHVAVCRAYLSVFAIAKENYITTLALPLLGYYAQHYPYDIARALLMKALAQSPDTDDLAIKLIYPSSLPPIDWQELRAYVSARLHHPTTASATAYHNTVCEADAHIDYRAQSRIHRELAEQLAKREPGFSPTLLSLITQSGHPDPIIYKKANIDRKLFSKIRNNPEYQPTKSTVLAFALALQLDLTATNDLLRTAGYTLTHTNKRDIIVEYFILQKNYDIFTVNEALFAFGVSSLGSN